MFVNFCTRLCFILILINITGHTDLLGNLFSFQNKSSLCLTTANVPEISAHTLTNIKDIVSIIIKKSLHEYYEADWIQVKASGKNSRDESHGGSPVHW